MTNEKKSLHDHGGFIRAVFDHTIDCKGKKEGRII